MRLAHLLLGSLLGSGPGDSLAYGCNDLVVIGRVQSLSYEHVELDDDILGRGWITATVTVRKSIRGRPPVAGLSVRYFTHTDMREDRDFVLALTPSDAGSYEVSGARLLESGARPNLAPTCGPARAESP